METAPGLHHAGKPRISWSRRELSHLAIALAALTVAFAFFRDPPIPFGDEVGRPATEWLMPDPFVLLASLIAVATGFVLHELAHKIVAQRYGHWAEFRAQFVGLAVTIALAIFGILVAAPGAVWIQGRVTPRQNGIISLVGPGFNFVVALAALPLSIATNPDGPLPTIFSMVAQVNGVLAVFNLIPLAILGVPLDGVKVWRWSKTAWILSFALALAAVIFIFLRTSFIAGPL